MITVRTHSRGKHMYNVRTEKDRNCTGCERKEGIQSAYDSR